MRRLTRIALSVLTIGAVVYVIDIRSDERVGVRDNIEDALSAVHDLIADADLVPDDVFGSEENAILHPMPPLGNIDCCF
ncbi:MAG: hypothetical protein OEV40_25085 [Acidimicrobiia bacterium]|nr:hypothetical protein [Acidimicrobiia bacterium]